MWDEEGAGHRCRSCLATKGKKGDEGSGRKEIEEGGNGGREIKAKQATKHWELITSTEWKLEALLRSEGRRRIRPTASDLQEDGRACRRLILVNILNKETRLQLSQVSQTK